MTAEHDLAMPGTSAVRFPLDLSENAFEPLPSVVAALAEAARSVNRYPEFDPRAFTDVVADWLGVPTGNVAVGAGATGVARQILAGCGRGGRVVLADPNFDGYRILAAQAGMPAVPVPLDRHGAQNLPAMAAAVRGTSDIVVVCRPHNPTGTVVTADALSDLLDALRHRATVILDEAYVEFLPRDQRLDPRALIERNPRLIVLRTFSKAFGLAGIRVGYGIGAAGIIRRVRDQQEPFGVNAMALPAVSASLSEEAELNRRVAEIARRRDRLLGRLRARGLAVPASSANFVFLPGADIAEALRRGGVRGKEYRGLGTRIGIGVPESEAAVLAALEPVLGTMQPVNG